MLEMARIIPAVSRGREIPISKCSILKLQFQHNSWQAISISMTLWFFMPLYYGCAYSTKTPWLAFGCTKQIRPAKPRLGC
jgi:hypothetical protein